MDADEDVGPKVREHLRRQIAAMAPARMREFLLDECATLAVRYRLLLQAAYAFARTETEFAREITRPPDDSTRMTPTEFEDLRTRRETSFNGLVDAIEAAGK